MYRLKVYYTGADSFNGWKDSYIIPNLKWETLEAAEEAMMAVVKHYDYYKNNNPKTKPNEYWAMSEYYVHLKADDGFLECVDAMDWIEYFSTLEDIEVVLDLPKINLWKYQNG